MVDTRRAGLAPPANPWPLVLCLVGVDYFSTLAYLPSIALRAAGPLAPIAAGAVVIVTFVLALPIYWYVVGRSADGRGAAGLLEDRIPGWRGKIVVLTLLGFAAADFVITRSLSLADAAIHVLHNPHGRELAERLPTAVLANVPPIWGPLEWISRRVAEPRVTVTLCLSVISFSAWWLLRHGARRRMLLIMAAAVVAYLAMTGLVIGGGLLHIARHPELWETWKTTIFSVRVGDAANAAPAGWLWAWASMALWTFPQMALGLSGFEMTMTVAPSISGGRGEDGIRRRVRNTRKLMVVAATIMAVYLVSAVAVTTLLVPREAVAVGGEAEHRALSYLAHSSQHTSVTGATELPLASAFGDHFGDVFDLVSVVVLCLAGATVTMGLRNLLPHYLHRLGMELSWAGKVDVILHVLNGVVLVLAVVFRASPSSQQWAYAASVLMLLAGAALAASLELGLRAKQRRSLGVPAVLAGFVAAFFLIMAGVTVLVDYSGLTIALAFVLAILSSSIVSRWARSTELRFEGFDFADEATHRRWKALCEPGAKVLAPHRPGLVPLAEKYHRLQQDYRLHANTPLVFVQAEMGDPSNFYQKPLMRIERDGELEVIRVSKCVSVSHVLAAIGLEMGRAGGPPPEIIFGWSNEAPLAANLNFLLLGEGNIPWMVKALVRRALTDESRQPRILIG